MFFSRIFFLYFCKTCDTNSQLQIPQLYLSNSVLLLLLLLLLSSPLNFSFYSMHEHLSFLVLFVSSSHMK